jgi:tungstate transport system permease protein
MIGEFAEAWQSALRLLLGADPDLFEILAVSLKVSVAAVAIATVLALPLAGVLALVHFPGRRAAIVALNACMGLPPVVVGLIVYLTLSRSGPLGSLGLLFTVPAMIIAQTLLVTPLIAALARQVLEDLWRDYAEQLRSMGAGTGRAALTLLWEARISLLVVVLAGFGRAIAEVGAVLIVGGNIAHQTRTMTTAIALETSRGDLALALGLGIVLITVALTINATVHVSRELVDRHAR